MNTPCPSCATPYPDEQLSCPACRALRFSEELKELHRQAELDAGRGDARAERKALSRMLELLPPGSRQYTTIAARLERPAPAHRPNFARWGALGGLALLLWKFKWVFGFLLTKGKSLLLGFTQLKTVFSMVIALGAYWTLWGWQFALGFVLSIYVHEMGHVIALRQLGIRASAPMFIPFVGAFVRLKDYPKTPHDDAVVGLAGPIYGVAASGACYAAYLLTDIAVLGGIAHAGAWINLFNLIPVWQLDGGRGFNALDQKQRMIAAGLVALAWLLSGDMMFVLVLLGAGYRIFFTPSPSEPGKRALFTFGALILGITLLLQIRVVELDAPRERTHAVRT